MALHKPAESGGASSSRGTARSRGAVLAFVSLLLALLTPLARPAYAVTLPSGFSQSTYASGLGRVTAMAFAPDGRLFVTEQDGAVRVVQDGEVLEQPFLRLDVDSRGERGLTGIVLDPEFATNRYVYLYYTVTEPVTHNRVSRFVADGDVARRVGGVVSEKRVLDLDPLNSSFIHNGGAMAFGPDDDKLYVAVGENSNGAHAQSLRNRLGKVLRVNSDGSIPSDNPFIGRGASGANGAIWAMGLRNPFTFDFSNSGRLLINDVGQAAWEEINDGVAGANYGWPATEGPTDDSRFRSPVYAYRHEGGDVKGCAITGGAFYDPSTARYPKDYVGDYFFADFCGHWIKRWNPRTGQVSGFATATRLHPVDLEVGPDGALYYLSRGDRSVTRVDYSTSSAPTLTEQPSDQSVDTGAAATFTVAASGAAPLSYRWQRNGRDIPGATQARYRLPSVDEADSGDTFRVVVSNSAGTVSSRAARLTVTRGKGPIGTISSPAAGSTYAGGDTIAFTGTAQDPDSGALPASAFTWQVDFHHAEHSHPFVAPFSGQRSGRFTVPRTGHVDSDVWYRIRLTVKDSDGRTSETFRDVKPRTVGLTVATVPAGLRVALDDQPRDTPHREQAVVGLQRKLDAPRVVRSGGTEYRFVSWSDGGAAAHTVTMPDKATTYTAAYRAVTTSGGPTSGGTPPNGGTPVSPNTGGASPGGIGGIPPTPAPDLPGTKRIAGQDRYATATAVSRNAFPAGRVPVVLVATGEAYADALAGGPAADALGGPLLLVTRTGLPAATRAELTRLQPARIVILGGPGAISEAVASALDDFTSGTVTRWAGRDRYATASSVAEAAFSGPVARVLVVTGAGHADALAAGAVGARTNSPVLLVGRDSLPSATAAALRRLRPRDITVVGGTSAVSAGVAEALRAHAVGGSVDRVAGSDRYATTSRIAQVFWQTTSDVVYLTTGRGFPDALSAVPAAGRDGAPVLLVEPTCMPAATARELQRLRARTVVVLGGTAAVSDAAAAGAVCGS